MYVCNCTIMTSVANWKYLLLYIAQHKQKASYRSVMGNTTTDISVIGRSLIDALI